MIGTEAVAVNVLIVEDYEPLAEVYALAMTLEGWTPRVTGNVREALVALTTYRPDVVLTDVMLPGGLSGIDLVRHLSSSDLGIPVVVMSAEESLELRAVAMASGARDFLRKPFSLTQLIDCLRAARIETRPTIA